MLDSENIYYYKDKPYRVVCESKVKIDGVWLDCVIYEALYENLDGKIWVRPRLDFVTNFRPLL